MFARTWKKSLLLQVCWVYFYSLVFVWQTVIECLLSGAPERSGMSVPSGNCRMGSTSDGLTTHRDETQNSPSPSAHIVCDSCARETCSSLWWASPNPSLSSREAKAPITLWRLDLIAPVCQLTSLSGLFNECIKHDQIKQPTKSLPQTVGTVNWKQLQSQLLPSADSPDFNYLRSVIPLIRIPSFFFYPFLLITERALPVTCSKIGPEDATSPEVTK